MSPAAADVSANDTGNLLHYLPSAASGDVWRMDYDNASDAQQPPMPDSSLVLKQPVHMVVIYALAYSAVFILGKRRTCYISDCLAFGSLAVI